MSTILVTGATGNVGSEVAKCLAQRGISFSVTTHRPEEAGEGKVYCDFEKPETLPAAFAGVEKLFLIRPPHIADAKKYFDPMLQAARQAGIQHIVFLSVMGADRNKIVPHAKIEQYIKASQIPYTFLRPSFFMQNLGGQHGDELRKENTLFVPAGRGKTSFIDTRDIGEVGAICLLEKQHQNRAYTLTGREALSYYEVAKIFTEELGRPITYAKPSGRAFRKQMRAKGLPPDMVTVMSIIYFTTRIGLAKKITPDLVRLLGRPPRTVRDYAHDYRDEL